MRKFGLDPLRPKFHPSNFVTKLPLVGVVAANKLTVWDVEKENSLVMLPEAIWMETKIEESLICVLKLATFERTIHVSLNQRVANTAEPATRAAVEVVLLLPYARPNTVMAVLPLCGTACGSMLLNRGEMHAAAELLPVDGL
jgi:hypothetical protein